MTWLVPDARCAVDRRSVLFGLGLNFQIIQGDDSSLSNMDLIQALEAHCSLYLSKSFMIQLSAVDQKVRPSFPFLVA